MVEQLPFKQFVIGSSPVIFSYFFFYYMSWFLSNLSLYVKTQISYLKIPIYIHFFGIFYIVDLFTILASMVDLNFIFFLSITFYFFFTFFFDFFFTSYLPNKNTSSFLTLFYFYFKNLLINKVNYFLSFLRNIRFFKLF